MSNETAEEVLNRGVPVFSDRFRTAHPAEVYCIHRGVVYRAIPTNPGQSYHGFPELPKALRGLRKDLRNRILDLARQLNQEDEVRDWIDGEPEIEDV